MTTHWIFWSFIASILTNGILVSGVLALIYYVGENKSSWLFEHHDQVEIVICWVFTLYLFLMSAVNGNSAHWTFFNEMVIVSFVFNLLMVSRIHWIGAQWFIRCYSHMAALP